MEEAMTHHLDRRRLQQHFLYQFWDRIKASQGRIGVDDRGPFCALPTSVLPCDPLTMNEIIFEVREDELEGGFVATALGYAIATQGDTVEELRVMVRDAVHCHFGEGEPGPMPKIIRLHFVRDEALAV